MSSFCNLRQVNILSKHGSISSRVRWDEQIVNRCNLFSNVKSCGAYLLNFHLFPMWCICNLIVSSLTWNVKPRSWHVRLESNSTTLLNLTLLNETGLPDLGTSSRFSSPELNFWNQLRAVRSFTASSPNAKLVFREASESLDPSLISYSKQERMIDFLSTTLISRKLSIYKFIWLVKSNVFKRTVLLMNK